MKSFDDLYELALERHGDALAERVRVEPLGADALAAVPDDRWLAQMAKRVFAAGFVWRVIDAKWDGFEEAFDGFDVPTVAGYGADEIGKLQTDTRIVRNGQKITATVKNAQFVQAISAEHGGFGRWVADWPQDDIVGLWDALHKRGSRLGGATGPMFLRFMGRDTFMLSKDVVARLVAEGIIDKAPTSKRARAAVQEAFMTWRSQSGRPFGEISRVLACTIDA